MAIDAGQLKSLIARELADLSDARVTAHIRALLVEPKIVMRDWDYGAPGEQFPCWAVLEHAISNTGIAYCESGFGPRRPWGLVWLGPETMSIGQDSGWFPSFLDAYFDSLAVTDLPIWRVCATDASGARTVMTDEGTWEATWQRVYELRKADPSRRYDARHGIAYGR